MLRLTRGLFKPKPFIMMPNRIFKFKPISSKPNITMDIIEKYPNKPWDWYGLSSNPNITMGIIEKYPNKLWSWNGISSNPNITMDIIEKYPNKPWSWYGISNNHFLYDNNVYLRELNNDIKKRKAIVKNKIKDIFYNDIINYKATNKRISSFVIYNTNNYKIPSRMISNYKIPSRMISNYKNPTNFNRKLNNVINILACTFLAGSLIFYIVNFVTFEFVCHFCHIYSLLWSIYFIANTNNAYVTLFIFGTSFIILGIIILWHKR